MTAGTEVIVVGCGLSGLVAATETADGGRRVLLLVREGEQDLGGLFLVDSPEQRRLGIRDALEEPDGSDDHWPHRWAEAYLQFAAGE